ncbi:molybdopterin-dependent oxidoreductase [Paracoccus aminophilus]|uniref:Oxidoreductase molybdopterin-binding domain-containing protein n=1 Tax=Paracoccus aminophilus JCM 7686 TaxID=1367847 RepID=S5XUI3_PARAH|nr:molybdopterin-dependent oxidoreductase [Paracoccus aminophilus]AGT11149.1 hypothetical protein JCM7686_pAMI5p083 [Paracoccus aminophilus JCM 7686]
MATGPTSPAQAQEDDHTPLEVILSVTGTDGVQHDFSEEEFNQLPQHQIVTNTTWTDTAQTFDGVLMRDLLAAVGDDKAAMQRHTVDTLALNDYRINIPIEDIYHYDAMVARKINGVPMSRRDKGPYWLVYPRDTYPELKDALYDYRWIWQLRSVIVK